MNRRPPSQGGCSRTTPPSARAPRPILVLSTGGEGPVSGRTGDQNVSVGGTYLPPPPPPPTPPLPLPPPRPAIRYPSSALPETSAAGCIEPLLLYEVCRGGDEDGEGMASHRARDGWTSSTVDLLPSLGNGLGCEPYDREKRGDIERERGRDTLGLRFMIISSYDCEGCFWGDDSVAVHPSAPSTTCSKNL